MRILLDTHAFLWFVADDARLAGTAKAMLCDRSNHLHLSVASAWEIAIKVGLGRLSVSDRVDDFIERQLRLNGIGLLPIALAHLGVVCALPMHHRDPFDRLLVAQAISDGLVIASRDEALDAYGVSRIW